MNFKKILFCLFCTYSILQINIFPIPISVVEPVSQHIYTYQRDVSWDRLTGFLDLEQGVNFENSTVSIGMNFPLYELLHFKNNSMLILENSLELDSKCTLSIDKAATIYGNGNEISLHSNLIIPENRSLEFSANTIIDGQNNELLLSDDSQLIIDSNVTLTLRNLRLKTSINSTETPAIKTFLGSQLCLQNVLFDLGEKFVFENGNLFIKNDVILFGENEFVYSSTQNCFIDKDSTLIIDLDTQFTYSPYSDNRDLIVMQDNTSQIFLNGCTIASTYTGMRLTKGTLNVDNHVTFSTIILDSIPTPNQLLDSEHSFSNSKTITYSTNYTGTYVNDVSILSLEEDIFMSTTINYLIAAGGGVSNNKIESYRINENGSLTFIDNSNTSGAADSVNVVERGYIWNNFYFYTGENSNVITKMSIDEGGNLSIDGNINSSNINMVYALSYYYNDDQPAYDAPNWLAVGGKSNTGSGGIIEIYDESTLQHTTNFTGTCVYALDFNTDGNLLAAGGDDQNNEFKTYSVDMYTGALTLQDSVDLGGTCTVFSVQFSPDNSLLAVGSNCPSNEISIYQIEINGNLTFADSANYDGTTVKKVKFTPDGNFLVVGGNNASNEIEIYEVSNSGKLKLRQILNYGGSTVNTIAINEAGNYLAIGGDNIGAEIETRTFVPPFYNNYNFNYNWSSLTPQNASINDNGITFGNSTLGPDYNLKINILRGTKLDLEGILNIDNVS